MRVFTRCHFNRTPKCYLKHGFRQIEMVAQMKYNPQRMPAVFSDPMLMHNITQAQYAMLINGKGPTYKTDMRRNSARSNSPTIPGTVIILAGKFRQASICMTWTHNGKITSGRFHTESSGIFNY
jgi:hypothetical protein